MLSSYILVLDAFSAKIRALRTGAIYIFVS